VHGRGDAHAGYGKQWVETLKAAIEVIPNPVADEDARLADDAWSAAFGCTTVSRKIAERKRSLTL
jgi:hypothetical protein